MVEPVPSGLARGLTAAAAADALRRVRPRHTLRRTLRTIAADLVTELRRLDRRIAEATQTLADTAVRWIVGILVVLHGLIHLLGAA